MKIGENVKRLLCIMSNSMNRGGAETFLMKIYRQIDRTQYQLDFCIPNTKKGVFDDEIISLGGKIHYSSLKKDGILEAFKSIKKIVKENNYEYVMRVNEHSLSVIDLIAAKCGGAKNLIMRSSNANSPSSTKRILHKAFLFLPKTIPTVKFAPSTKAAEYTFGKNCIKKGKAHLLHNAINVDNYLFDENERKRLRKDLNIEDKFVIGHIGRFMHQKNHGFLIDIFYEITKQCNNAHLVLIGDGSLKAEIEEKVKNLKISDRVSFLGVRNDVPKLLSAIDVKLFPSLFEGMPNTVIEAQASGLHCVISDTITKEADITGLVDYMSLNADAKTWADKALQYQSYERKNMKDVYIENGYDIQSAVNKFIELVF